MVKHVAPYISCGAHLQCSAVRLQHCIHLRECTVCPSHNSQPLSGHPSLPCPWYTLLMVTTILFAVSEFEYLKCLVRVDSVRVSVCVSVCVREIP